MTGKTRNKTNTALQYVRGLSEVCKANERILFMRSSRYSGKKGARLFAREIGSGFNDFPQSQTKRASDESYKIICTKFYGKGCLTKDEWEKEIKKRLK